MIEIRRGVVPDDIEMCAQLWVHALAHRDGVVAGEAVAGRVRTSFTSPIVRFAIAAWPRSGFALTESGQADPADALLHFLAVDPRTPSRGVGTALLADAIEHATAGGFSSLALEVRIDNVRAIGLYERAGFIPDGDVRQHPLGGEPMQPFRLRLNPAPRSSSA
jgi:ribosomal protein S18 acetylase RimI-like enzyme